MKRWLFFCLHLSDIFCIIIHLKMQSVSDIYLTPLPTNYPLRQVAQYFQQNLQLPKHIIEQSQIMSEPVDVTKKSTIVMDVQRTRSAFFPKQLKPQMQKILVHFCRLQKLQYKQGLNEILMPFIYLKTAGVSLSRCYAMFRSFFDQYCLNFYYDKDFNSLEIIFKMVTVMIKYHDPALARYLENYEIEPQLYSISWLMTLFSSKLPLSLTYTLWQLIIVEKDDYFVFYLIIAIIINRREIIIQTKTNSIFSVITNLIFKDQVQLQNTVKIALLLRKTTPASLIIFFREHKIFKQRQSFERINNILMSIDKLNLFLVGPLQVSLKQHFSLGMCQKKCYFCTLKQPLKIHYSHKEMEEHFPLLNKLVALSDDIRTMDHTPEFIIVDIRKDKSSKLSKIEGIRIYEVNTEDLIENVEAKFNQEFMHSRGKDHFLFLLNNFSFQKAQSFESNQFYFCNKLIKILNSYSYCYLSMLEGGEASYGYFIKDLRLKSQLLNSRLAPVSEYGEEDEGEWRGYDDQSLVGKDKMLEISEIVSMQSLYDQKKLDFFQGEDDSSDFLLFVHQGFLMLVERHGLLQKLCKYIRQHKSIINHLLDQHYVLQIPFKITFLHSLFRVQKLSARVHHNNCVIFYVQQSSQQNKKKYLKGNRKDLWTRSLQQIVLEDLQYGGPFNIRRVAFESGGFEMVKSISSIVKRHFRQLVLVKRTVMQQGERVDDLNKNIIQECDFSRKDVCEEVGVTDLD